MSKSKLPNYCNMWIWKLKKVEVNLQLKLDNKYT